VALRQLALPVPWGRPSLLVAPVYAHQLPASPATPSCPTASPASIPSMVISAGAAPAHLITSSMEVAASLVPPTANRVEPEEFVSPVQIPSRLSEVTVSAMLPTKCGNQAGPAVNALLCTPTASPAPKTLPTLLTLVVPTAKPTITCSPQGHALLLSAGTVSSPVARPAMTVIQFQAMVAVLSAKYNRILHALASRVSAR